MNELLHFLENGKTQFHVVALCKEYLNQHEFREISMKDTMKPLPAGRYFISPFSSVIIPFVIGNDVKKVRVATAHTDFPMLKLKSKPEITKQGYFQVNVEPYGGMIKETWFDRPLGLAGKVVCTGDTPFTPVMHLFDSGKPVCVIPNLAPHLKRGGKECEMDVQKEMLPVVGIPGEGEKTDSQFMMRYIAETLNVNVDDILDYDLYFYINDAPQKVGLKEEFISASRIDNISSVCGILESLVSAADTCADTLMIGALFDNEEIGSRSKQGADSFLLRDVIDRLLAASGSDVSLAEDGFYLSVDVAHATHPNYSEKSDITNPVTLGCGVVLKNSASQRYVCDSEAGAVLCDICRRNHISLQRTVNRSGMPGGQTLGPILSSYLPMRACDIGIPVLAMHSAREMMHSFDYTQLTALLTLFFKSGR